jgi:hypothetical protein
MIHFKYAYLTTILICGIMKRAEMETGSLFWLEIGLSENKPVVNLGVYGVRVNREPAISLQGLATKG